MTRRVKIVNDFEDCDEEWKHEPCGKFNIPPSTQTGKIALREVAQGKVVKISFDDGLHDATKKYLEAMCKEYDLPLKYEIHCFVISPRPQVMISAESDDPE